MVFKQRAYFPRVVSNGATAIQLFESSSQMSDPLRALADQQHVKLVIHKRSVKVSRSAKDYAREALNLRRFTHTITVCFLPQLELFPFKSAILRFKRLQSAQRNLISHNQQANHFAEFVWS
jgi:hypothetical protein